MATDINSVVLVGNITHDLDGNAFGYTSTGTARANVSIAVNRSKKQGDQWVDEASFFDITIWGKTAENLKPYLVKGQKIAVQGFLKQDRWKDQDGNNRSRVSIVAESVELCGKKASENNATDNTQSAAQTFKPVNNPVNNPAENEPMAYSEDIPF